MSRTSVFPMLCALHCHFSLPMLCSYEEDALVVVRMTQLAVAFLDFSEFAERQPLGGNWVWQSQEISPFLDH